MKKTIIDAADFVFDDQGCREMRKVSTASGENNVAKTLNGVQFKLNDGATLKI
jgi:hypothetical protein